MVEPRWLLFVKPLSNGRASIGPSATSTQSGRGPDSLTPTLSRVREREGPASGRVRVARAVLVGLAQDPAQDVDHLVDVAFLDDQRR